MNTKYNSDHKIGEIVSEFPGASDIFYKYNIDFCCGGNRPLKTAIKEKELDEGKLLTDLNQASDEFTIKNKEFVDWANEAPSKLVDYIVNTHHAYLNEELPKLSEYTNKIMKVHGKNHSELFKVHRLFNNLRTELEEHLVKEEEFLFPLIKKSETDNSQDNKNKVRELIDELEREHIGAGDIIKELREVTHHYLLPEDSCKTFASTYKNLQKLEGDLFQHIHLENNILFKNM